MKNNSIKITKEQAELLLNQAWSNDKERDALLAANFQPNLAGLLWAIFAYIDNERKYVGDLAKEIIQGVRKDAVFGGRFPEAMIWRNLDKNSHAHPLVTVDIWRELARVGQLDAIDDFNELLELAEQANKILWNISWSRPFRLTDEVNLEDILQRLSAEEIEAGIAELEARGALGEKVAGYLQQLQIMREQVNDVMQLLLDFGLIDLIEYDATISAEQQFARLLTISKGLARIKLNKGSCVVHSSKESASIINIEIESHQSDINRDFYKKYKELLEQGGQKNKTIIINGDLDPSASVLRTILKTGAVPEGPPRPIGAIYFPAAKSAAEISKLLLLLQRRGALLSCYPVLKQLNDVGKLIVYDDPDALNAGACSAYILRCLSKVKNMVTELTLTKITDRSLEDFINSANNHVKILRLLDQAKDDILREVNLDGIDLSKVTVKQSADKLRIQRDDASAEMLDLLKIIYGAVIENDSEHKVVGDCYEWSGKNRSAIAVLQKLGAKIEQLNNNVSITQVKATTFATTNKGKTKVEVSPSDVNMGMNP